MDWLSKIIEKFVDRYSEQKAFPKYLSGIKNLIRANHKEDVKSLSLFKCYRKDANAQKFVNKSLILIS